MSSAGHEQSPPQFTLRWLLAVTAIVAMLMGGIAFVRRAYLESVRPRPGVMENPSEWPRSIQELVADARAADIAVDPVRVYCWDTRYTLDADYLVQMPDSPALMNVMAKRWPLTAANKWEENRLWKCMPPGWATPGSQPGRSYSAYWGHKSDNVVVMVDGSTGLVYLCYYWNF
jgi:hypothetical protein